MHRNITIRAARAADAPQLLAIYRPYVTGTAITFEIEVPAVEEFTERIRSTLEKYPYLVAEEDGAIVGYCYASAFKERAAYDYAVETSIYVDVNARHSGVGRALYEALEDALRRMHITNLNACIGYPTGFNEHLDRNSVEFHEHMGYRMVGRFHDCGYKFGRWYDMVWMEKMIADHPAEPEPVIPFSEL